MQIERSSSFDVRRRLSHGINVTTAVPLQTISVSSCSACTHLVKTGPAVTAGESPDFTHHICICAAASALENALVGMVKVF